MRASREIAVLMDPCTVLTSTGTKIQIQGTWMDLPQSSGCLQPLTVKGKLPVRISIWSAFSSERST